MAVDPRRYRAASGPRVIRPLDEPQVDRKTLAAFNRRILSYGACDFGDSVPEEQQFRSIDNTECAGCHDGARRGRLYAVHRPMILFKLDREGTMPVTLPVRRAASALIPGSQEEEFAQVRRTIP